MSESGDDLSGRLAVYRELLSKACKAETSPSYLLDIASIVTEAFKSAGASQPIIVGGLAVET